MRLSIGIRLETVVFFNFYLRVVEIQERRDDCGADWWWS